VNAQATLFDEVVRASGLVDLIAPFAISRMLVGAGITSPRDITREELERALPSLEEGLSTYLRGDDLDAAREALRQLTA
jgi:hypothetical protein